MMGRRPFLIGCGGMAAAPAFAHLALPMTVTLQSQSQSTAADSSAAAAFADQDFALRIHGWDTPNDLNPAAHGEVWIQINSSWRASWR